MAESLTVLMLDDDRQTTTIVGALLAQRGFSTHACHDSRATIVQLRRWKPRAVVIDIMMPHVNGYRVARRIRREPGYEHVPIIAVSSLSSDEHFRRAADAGIDEALTKPVDVDQLETVIRQQLRAAGREEAGPPGHD